MDSGEGYDRNTLKLRGDQEILLQAIIETGKQLVVIYIQGSPLDMNFAEGAHAVADIIFNNYIPASQLPFSVPRSVGQLPVYYSSKPLVTMMEKRWYSFIFGTISVL